MAKWRIGTFPSASRIDKGNDMPRRFVDTKANRRARSKRSPIDVEKVNEMPFDFDSIEEGWKAKEHNERKPARNPTTQRVDRYGSKQSVPTHAKNHNFTNVYDDDGNVVKLTNGPGAGHSLMLEDWVSPDKQVDFYETAFVKDTQHVQEFTEEEGLIVSMHYNYNLQALLVKFRNWGSVCLFRNVDTDEWNSFKSAKGQTDNSRKPPHNHMVGIRFWDLVRIRGTVHGVKKNPWWYVVKGSPSEGSYAPRVTGGAQRKAEKSIDEALEKGNKYVKGKKKSLNDTYSAELDEKNKQHLKDIKENASKLTTDDMFTLLDDLAVDPYVDKAIAKNPNGKLAKLIDAFNNDALDMNDLSAKSMVLEVKLWADTGYKKDINSKLDNGDW